MNRKGFTLTEFAAGLMVSAILLLTVGVMARTGSVAFTKLDREAEVYNDIYFGFDLIQRSVRRAAVVTVDTINNILTVDNFVFKKNNRDFIYTDTTTNQQNVILADVDGLVFTPDISDEKFVTVTLSGTKATLKGTTDKVKFDLSTKVMRRNSG